MRTLQGVRGLVAIAGAGLVGAAFLTNHSPAEAAGGGTVSSCATMITSSGTWNVTADIGPCTGHGIDIMAANVTLNLDGHTITGNDVNNTSGAPKDQQLGIALMNVHAVTVNGPGTVTAFDAGVAILGGAGNRVMGVTAHDNIAHVLLTGGAGGMGDPSTNACDFGDGIMTDNSSGNQISGSTSYHNGPYSGIALVDASNGNKVTGNNTHDQTVSNILVAGTPGAGLSGPCGPFGANIVGRGRAHQDTGIRIEGPGARGNTVSGNTSTANQLEGIAVHSHICDTSPNYGGPPPTIDNSDNTISNNTVSGNGFADNTHGIAILEQGPVGVVCPSSHETITGNTSTGNANDGIYVGGRGSGSNTVTSNTLNSNGHDGIELAGPETAHNGDLFPGSISNSISGNSAHSNPHFDAEDKNPGCDSNTWTGDSFGTVSQSCIH